MYIPEHFRERRPEALRTLIERHPLAVLLAQTPEGLVANHIPMQLLDAPADRWRLRGHVARANPLWRAAPLPEVLVVFRGAEHYVSPNWYPSKQTHGRAVPTWNYAAVHLWGQIRFIEEPAWLRVMAESMTAEHERTQPHPWQLGEAPPDYVQAMLGAIVGFEIDVARIEGKIKASQNRALEDRSGVAAALAAEGVGAEAAGELVREP